MKQHDKIIEYMQTHGTVTPMEAFSKLRITKLATRVGELRQGGWNIADEWVRGRDGDGMPTRYKRYWLV